MNSAENSPTYDARCRRWRDGARFVATSVGRRRSTRQERARELAACQHVHRRADGFAVVSIDLAHVYSVTASGCNCPDSTYRPGTVCKHMRAVFEAARKSPGSSSVQLNETGAKGATRNE